MFWSTNVGVGSNPTSDKTFISYSGSQLQMPSAVPFEISSVIGKQCTFVHYELNIYPTQKFLSEVGFEPTPTEVDCDLNAAP